MYIPDNIKNLSFKNDGIDRGMVIAPIMQWESIRRVTQQFVLHASMITRVLNPYEH
jgi:hypothetical protein